MSLYGLDIVVDQEGKPYLLELNGVRSGMRGFQQIYGDNRVHDRVCQMLSDKYGTLMVNNGTYSRARFRRQHPFRYAYGKTLDTLVRAPVLGRHINAFAFPKVLTSPHALIDWLSDAQKEITEVFFPYPGYEGQESTVINIFNERNLLHPPVNSYVAEEITRNKLLQYLVLQNTPVHHALPPTTLVGLGWVAQDLEEILEKDSSFVLKPLLGYCGQGVSLIEHREIWNFKSAAGPLFPPERGPLSLSSFLKNHSTWRVW